MPNRDAYFNRALVKKMLGNKEGFCSNMQAACGFKDSLATDIFYNQCTVSDTIYKSNKRKIIFKDIYAPQRVTFLIDSFGIRKWYHFYNKDSLAILDTINYLRKNPADYVRVNKLPEFPGGEAELMRFLKKNIVYPQFEKKHKVIGLVMVKFIVTDEGNVENVEAIWGESDRFIDEAIRVVKLLPKFKPATMDGKPVKFIYKLPISFR